MNEEEMKPWPTIDGDTLLGRALASKSTPVAAGTVDPYQLMLQRKQAETTEPDAKTIQKWPEADVQALNDYCAKMGIQGFSCGKMSPIAALAMLRKQLGDDYTGVPLEERIPAGYEKMGTKTVYGPNYPYTQAMQKKQVLHG